MPAYKLTGLSLYFKSLPTFCLVVLGQDSLPRRRRSSVATVCEACEQQRRHFTAAGRTETETAGLNRTLTRF